MTDLKFKPGKAVDSVRAMRRGAWAVAEYRLFSMSKWMGSMISFGLGNPIIYLVSIGLGIGALVDANTGGQGIDGVSYIEFVAPALLATAAINSLQDEVTFPTMQGFVWDKMFFAMNNTPITARQIANGIMTTATIRGIFTVILYESVLLVFGAIPLSSALPLFVSSMIAALAFGAAMLAVTVRIENDDALFAIIGRFVIAPMFLFSGTFYPLDQMPIYLQWIGWISPMWHSTQLGRFLSYGMPLEVWEVIMHGGFLAALFTLGMLLAYPKFESRLQK
jgi:lipooligosaccharide transport system permease protein